MSARGGAFYLDREKPSRLNAVREAYEVSFGSGARFA